MLRVMCACVYVCTCVCLCGRGECEEGAGLPPPDCTMVRNGQQIAKTLLQHRRPAKINLDVACAACGGATDSLGHTHGRVYVCVCGRICVCCVAADVAPLPQGVYRLIDIDTVGSYVAGAVAAAACCCCHTHYATPSTPTTHPATHCASCCSVNRVQLSKLLIAFHQSSSC